EGIKKDDQLLFTGPTTGALYSDAKSLFVKEEEAESVEKGRTATIKVPDTVRVNDKVFLIRKRTTQ
ncbi:MAG: U32 family peptidase, partial [Candidatus Nanoarchaeia archaeon]